MVEDLFRILIVALLRPTKGMHLYIVVNCKTANCATAHVLTYLGEKGKTPASVRRLHPLGGKVRSLGFRRHCEAEAAMVDDVAKEFVDKGLIVLAVDVLEPDQKVKKYLVEHPRSVPIVLTKDTNLAAMYNAQSYPIYVVIDRDGNIARLPISLTTGTLLSRLSIQIGDLLTRSMQKLRPLW